MKQHAWISSVMCAAIVLGAGMAFARPGEGRRQDRQEIRKDREEVERDRQNAREDRKALRKDRREGKDTAADRQKLREDRQELRKDQTDLRKDSQNLRQDSVDRREQNQAKRIEQGVKNGSLTPDELTKLQTQQQSIANLEQSFKSDGRLSPAETYQLQQQLDIASRTIFADKHNADGYTMPVHRLGENVFLKSDVVNKLGDPNLAPSEAKAYSHDFGQMLQLKHKLASGTLSDEDRTKAQTEYNDLLNKYFDVK